MFTSIILFSFFGWPNPLVRVVMRILFIPIVAGISYEIIKFLGKYNNKFTKIVAYPGMMLQKFTTKEPDDEQHPRRPGQRAGRGRVRVGVRRRGRQSGAVDYPALHRRIRGAAWPKPQSGMWFTHTPVMKTPSRRPSKRTSRTATCRT